MTLLRNQDGVGWRDKLPKPEPQSYKPKGNEKLNSNGDSVAANESLNVKQIDDNDGKDVRKEVDGNDKQNEKKALNEKQFKIIKEQGNLFVQKVCNSFVLF